MISERALEKFKEIWRAEFGEEVADEVAISEATKLLTLFSAIYKPVKKSWLSSLLTRFK
jgi:hypothetical protein